MSGRVLAQLMCYIILLLKCINSKKKLWEKLGKLKGSNRPDTETIFKLLTMDAAINITKEDTKEENRGIDSGCNYQE